MSHPAFSLHTSCESVVFYTMPPKPKSLQSAKKTVTPTLSSAKGSVTSPARPVAAPPPPPVQTTPFEIYYNQLLEFATPRRILLISAVIAAIFLCAALVLRKSEITNLKVMRAQAAEDWPAAIAGLQSLYGTDPQQSEVNVMLAHCLVETNKPADALKRLDAISSATVTQKIMPDAAMATRYYTVRGRARLGTGAVEPGVEDLRAALKLNADCVPANAAMGRYFLDKKSPAEAGPFIEKLAQTPKYDALLKEYRAQFKQGVESVPVEKLQDVPAKTK